MGNFRIQLLPANNTWRTGFNVPKIDRYGNYPTQWSLISLKCTVEMYSIKIFFDQIDTPHADMCFSNVIIILISMDYV